jgi:uncharacterized protein YecT (DUF1311 family)
MRQAAQAEWQRLPASELSCLDQSLRQQGASVDALLGRGVSPSDPRLAQLRSNCRSQVAEGPRPATGQPFPYVVDGLALGGQVRFESEAYKQYDCTPSDKFPGFTWCHKEKTEKTSRGEVTSSNSILHSQDGTAVYVNRYIEPAFFGSNEVRSEIDRLSAKFGERAREFRMPPREGPPNAIIAVWGKIELEPLDAADVSTVASGGSVKGLLVSFLGDLQRSAKAGVPVYELAGGAGFLWAATFNQDGRGVLRFLTIDASRIALPIVAQNTPAPPSQSNNKATPGFSCSGNLFPTEAVICSDEGLASLDRQLAAVYGGNLRNLPADQQAELKAADRTWVAERNRCRTDKSCIGNAYQARISSLGGHASEISPPIVTQNPTARLRPHRLHQLNRLRHRYQLLPSSPRTRQPRHPRPHRLNPLHQPMKKIGLKRMLSRTGGVKPLRLQRDRGPPRAAWPRDRPRLCRADRSVIPCLRARSVRPIHVRRLTMRPRCSAILGSRNSRRCALRRVSVPSSSAPIIRL